MNENEETKRKGRPVGSKKKVNIIWAPQDKQAEAMVRQEFEVLYGGARGGGKTDAGMAWLLYPKDNPRYRALVIRLNAKDLNDWIDRARRMYAGTGAEFVGSPVEIRFPSGAIIRTGHLNDEKAYTQYQGHEYQRILIEELTQIPSEANYEKLIASCRSTVPEIQPRVFCTTNPGELGHDWVKSRWRIGDHSTWGNPFVGMTGTVNGETVERTRIFISAKVEDNPKLVDADPGYVAMLDSIADPNLKKAWRDGDWDNPIIPGQIYKDELDASMFEGRIGQVLHNPRYHVYTYWDLGVGDLTAIWFMQFIRGVWYAIDYYSSSGKGLLHYKEILASKPYSYGQHFGPHDLSQRRFSDKANAESVAKIAEDLGIVFTVLPKQKVQHRIEVTKIKFAMVNFDKDKCKDGLAALKAYRREYDEDNRIYLDKPVHDWSSNGADAFGYWAEAPDPVPPGSMGDDWNLYKVDYK